MGNNAAKRLEELFQSLANYERTRALPEDWSLDTMHGLLGRLLPTERWGQAVQVGGSKGKGTTVAYLEALAGGAGLRTGAFVSPHLIDVTERVRIDGEPVAAERLVEAMEQVIAVARELGLDPSFFEAMAAAAVVVFAAERVDLAIFEVGLGGRCDATTAVPVDASILTHIELEHTDILGDTIEAIATEKAFVMRPGKPVFTWPTPATDPVFRVHAADVGAEWREIPGFEDERESDSEWCIALAGRPIRLLDASRFERPAAVLATLALSALFPDTPLPTDPVPRPALPGRFEVFERGGWPLILDGAHTKNSCAGVADELCRRFPHQPVAVLFASAADKPWQEGLSAFLPLADTYFVTTLEGTNGVPAAEVAVWLRARGKRVTEVDDPIAGLRALESCEAVRLIVGSFYLAGAVRAALIDQA